MKKPSSVAFNFVIEQLHQLQPQIKPMFGCHALYVENKIVLMLRKKENNTDDNGVWIATTPEHHQDLKKLFPSLRSIRLFGPKESGWQILPEDADDFEESAMRVCDLIVRRDPRIGKIPKARKKKS
jgi:hypothetical protein